MILMSACLAGVNCKYDGGNNKKESFLRMAREGKVVLICPEQLGGLNTPRLPCEIMGGNGKDVLKGHAMVLDKEKNDKSQFFIRGAQEALKIANLYGIKKAVLKSKSPSCGSGEIYDGRFQGKTKEGDGVTAALLKENGITVLTEDGLF